MQVHLATDHAGFTHKTAVMEWGNGQPELSLVDHGAKTLDPADDFPDFIALAAAAVAAEPATQKAIIFGGSGQGEAMLANQFPGVRATVYYGGDPAILTLSREHNDANVLSLGARFMTPAEAVAAVEQWLQSAFTADERHVRRVKKMATYPKA